MVQVFGDTIAVTTLDPALDIATANGSGAWALDARKWEDKLRWLVCREKVGTDRRAFLVGRISGIVERPAEPGDKRKRYVIEITDYAALGPETKLSKGSQYPVAFGTLEQFTGLNENAIRAMLQPVPAKTLPYSYTDRVAKDAAPRSLTIAEAKRGLAQSLGLLESQIDIIIRA